MYGIFSVEINKKCWTFRLISQLDRNVFFLLKSCTNIVDKSGARRNIQLEK